jgi:hypothetical protein
MNLVRCIPLILSTLLLGAHFSRADNMVLVSLLALLPFLLFVRRPWVAGLYTGVLLLGAAEWVRTLLVIADARQAMGAPWMRMAVILGAVALVTALSPLVFATKSLRARYQI